MVCLTPVGSSDTASYAAYGRIVGPGRQPVHHQPARVPRRALAYTHVVGTMWKTQPSVYGPFATVIQSFAASIGRGERRHHHLGPDDPQRRSCSSASGLLLLKTSDDPVRATLFWTANPVLIQQLVSGGHLDTLVAAAAICAIQVARRVTGDLGRRRWSGC